MSEPGGTERYLSGGGDRRRGGWRLATLALVVLAAFVAAVWYAYDQGVKRGVSLSPPLIRAEPGPTKVRPEEPGGLEVPHQDKLIFETLTPGQPVEGGERLLPPPEEPIARLKPEPTMEAGEAEVAEAAVEPAPEEADPPETRETPETPAQALAAVAPRAPVTEEGPAATEPAAVFRVQLASYRDAGAATRVWHRLAQANPTLLGELKPNVVRADLGPERGVFYRLQAGPLPDRTAAAALCEELKARKLECLVVAP